MLTHLINLSKWRPLESPLTGFIKFLSIREAAKLKQWQFSNIEIFSGNRDFSHSLSTKYCQLLSPKFSFNEMTVKCKSKSPWLPCLLLLHVKVVFQEKCF